MALDLGFIQIHWYGLMYLIGFAAALLLGNYRADQENSGWNREQVSDFIFFGERSGSCSVVASAMSYSIISIVS